MALFTMKEKENKLVYKNIVICRPEKVILTKDFIKVKGYLVPDLNVLKSSVEVVTVQPINFGESYLVFVGHGVELGRIKVMTLVANKAMLWITKNLNTEI